MSFLEPQRLWLLLIPLALAAGYLVMQARRPRYAVRFANVALLDKVAPDRPGWRRHVTAIGLLLALAAVSMSIAKPARAVQVPKEVSTVILAVDVSLSMGAEDVDPNRIEAAQRAALDFIDLAPEGMQIGLVTFSGNAAAVVAPTDEKGAVAAAIARIQLGEGTAIGEAIYTALDMAPAATGDDEDKAPATIVVLSDGETTVGRSELEAADEAALRGIPVSTVAFGTDAGFVVIQGETIPVPANEGVLQDVADTTGGRFFEAASAGELQAVLDNIGAEVGFTEEQEDLSDLFAFGGLGLASLAALGALLWFTRLP